MKPHKVSDMIEHRQTEPDRWGITIPYDALKREFKDSFWLEFFRLKSEGKATLKEIPLLGEASFKANQRKMSGKPPLEKRKRWIRTVDHNLERNKI